jgi:cytochrome c556
VAFGYMVVRQGELRPMRFVLLLLVAVGVAACTTTMDSTPSNPQGVIAQRVSIMKGFGGALGASAAFVQGKGGADAHVKLTTAMANVDKLPGLFPRGTALGDRNAGTSRALSTIFTNRADFEAKAAAVGRSLGALDALIVRGAKSEAAKALVTTKAACGACHAKYRAADE